MIEHDLAALQPHQSWKDPIVIIGAGPVGMSAALGLAHYGVPSIILDDGEGPAIEGSRAIFMERHTLEVLGAWSPVGRQMAERGLTLTGGRVFFGQTELYRTLNPPPDPVAPYPRFVNMPQNLLEHLQYEALQQTHLCQVRWRNKVTGISQDEEGVTIEVMTPDGPDTLRAGYVLAADGPKSTVRRLLGLNFPGESRDHHFLILDVRMQLETPRERWFWFDPPFNPGRTALLHPQPDSIYRLDYQLHPKEDLQAAMEPESLHKRIVATVGERPYEIVWKSIYTYHQRVIERFAYNRVLFMGDSAHLMSPFGGRGLNSGVQDVSNLVWKLLLIRAGLATPALLETYHHERHAAAVENVRLTADTMQFLVPQPGLPRLRRDLILRSSLYFKFMRRHVNAGHMSNPSTYRDSPIVTEDRVLSTGSQPSPEHRSILKKFRLGPVAGSLAPVPALTDVATGETVALIERFSRGFTILYFCDDVKTAAAAVRSVRDELPELPLAIYFVVSRPPAEPLPDIHILLDSEGKAATAFSAVSGTLYMVRPDRHIAARRFKSDLSELPVLLRRAIGAHLEQPLGAERLTLSVRQDERSTSPSPSSTLGSV